MKIKKIIIYALIFILTLNACKDQDAKEIKYKIDTKDVLFYKNTGIKDKTAHTLFAEGLELVDIQDFEKAKEKFLKADKIESRNPIILNAIALSEAKLENIEKSIGILLNIISIDSTYTKTYVNLSQNYMRNRDYEKAKEILLKGKKYTSNKDLHTKSVLLLNLAISYSNLGDCENGVKYSSEALEISQDEKFRDFIKKVQLESKNCVEK